MRAAKTPKRRVPVSPIEKATLADTASEDQSPQTRLETPTIELSSAPATVPNLDGVIVLDPKGDLVLSIQHGKETAEASHRFRLSSSILQAKSKYFERLLQSDRFEEAKKVKDAHQALRSQYGDPAKAPADQLPVLDIRDLGRISSVKAVDALLTDFFLLLYGKDLPAAPPIANLANLAIVADRFDALGTAQTYVARKKLARAVDGKTTPKLDSALTEEKVRQRVLVAILLDYPEWLEKYSLRLITKGWVGSDVDVDAPLWWDLPSRIEEELEFRRECVLDTIQSLQAFFLSLYSSRKRQCKLGYDSSAQCDSFQLGEMVRFFTKIGTLQLKGSLTDADETPPQYQGDIFDLFDSLRQVPEYQIDKFHSHCGIRTRMAPVLDLLQEILKYVAIRADCWQHSRADYAWIDAKRPLLWKRNEMATRVGASSHSGKHVPFRDMFTAVERDWSN